MKARRDGAILNVSSAAAVNYFPGVMAYGMSKLALEHLTVSLAAQLRPFDVAVNTFRIDIPVASEGFIAYSPGRDRSDAEPTEVAAEGIVWMLRQPPSYTGRNAGMAASASRARDHGVEGRAPIPGATVPRRRFAPPVPGLNPRGRTSDHEPGRRSTSVAIVNRIRYVEMVGAARGPLYRDVVAVVSRTSRSMAANPRTGDTRTPRCFPRAVSSWPLLFVSTSRSSPARR